MCYPEKQRAIPEKKKKLHLLLSGIQTWQQLLGYSPYQKNTACRTMVSENKSFLHVQWRFLKTFFFTMMQWRSSSFAFS